MENRLHFKLEQFAEHLTPVRPVSVSVLSVQMAQRRQAFQDRQSRSDDQSKTLDNHVALSALWKTTNTAMTLDTLPCFP